jgi:hypothetical protein
MNGARKSFNPQASAAAAFDGDGEADRLWRDISGNVAMRSLNGAQVTRPGVGSVPAVWPIAETADFNGDGKGDILWQNTTTGDVAIWLITQFAGGRTVPTA